MQLILNFKGNDMSKVINGTVFYPMSARVQDTVAVHGLQWAAYYYIEQHGFAEWEFRILAGLPLWAVF